MYRADDGVRALALGLREPVQGDDGKPADRHEPDEPVLALPERGRRADAQMKRRAHKTAHAAYHTGDACPFGKGQNKSKRALRARDSVLFQLCHSETLKEYNYNKLYSPSAQAQNARMSFFSPSGRSRRKKGKKNRPHGAAAV